MTATIIGSLETKAPKSQRKYLKVTFVVEMDNTAAMFRRENFDKRIRQRMIDFNGSAALGGPCVLVTTEEVEP